MRKAPTFAVLAVALVGGLAIAQRAATKRPTLHEDLPPETNPQTSPTIGDNGTNNPAAFQAGKNVVPKPSVDNPDTAPKGEPVLGAGGFAADRQTSMTPDGNTGPDSTLHYVSVFNPDVLPFKRMSAFDGVANNYALVVRNGARVELPVGGARNDKTRDRFYGSVLIQLSPGKNVPLPSVAPDMRILSYEVNPKIALKFEKDGADNFFVRSDESSASGTYRLVFFADADAGYFAPSLPRGRYTPRTLGVPPSLKLVLPDRVKREAQVTLERLRVNPDMDLGEVFNALVGYFRAFEAKTLPASSGDIYRDLCDSQAGVCRHRAFAFMITANAIGIPTRFVENEAHAFVEVWFPERNWQRIDLGGAALRMEVQGADNKTLHRPRADDPFSKPQQYKQNYTQLQGDIAGLTKQQIADKNAPLDPGTASGSFGGGGGGSGNGTGTGGPTNIRPDPGLPIEDADPGKPTPRLLITRADTSAYRGDVVRVDAHVSYTDIPTGQRHMLADYPIDVFIAPKGLHGANSVPIGRAVTGPDGTFSQDFTIPPTVTLQVYEIYLSSQKDATFNAALSPEN
jgi:transglutaminase-like putative cysteine protease